MIELSATDREWTLMAEPTTVSPKRMWWCARWQKWRANECGDVNHGCGWVDLTPW